jgi:guanylate kinase
VLPAADSAGEADALSFRDLSPKLVVITGPSGAGKGTLIGELVDRMPELEVAVSATTRERRPGEVDGRDYWFLSDREFTRRVDGGEFLEHVTYVSGHRYGTLRSELDRIRNEGRLPVLELETEGALRVRREVPASLSIFVDAPSFAELERRLRERATESAGEIDERLAVARRQREQAAQFDHVVVNDDLLQAVEAVAAIVRRELATATTTTS